MARALFCSAPNVGASALMMKPTIRTPITAPTNVQTARASPAASDRRYVPAKNVLVPIRDAPMNPATALTAASGATYPARRLPVELGSLAITGHSVFGVRQMFFTRSTILILRSPYGFGL